MHSFTALTAASAIFAVVSGSPLMVRANTCGSAPSASNTNNQPISQPSGIQTTADCQAQCNANSSCKSFVFGFVDNAIQCKLFSSAASEIPTQSSSNLVAYDKACSDVPSVVPTSSNPTGKATSSNGQNSNSNGQTSNSNGQTSNSNGQASNSNSQTSTSNGQQRPTSQKQTSTTAQTCGSKPAGNTNNQPIATPSATSADDCKSQCSANASCKR